ncbi:MAG: NAD(P)-dependent oxidoreductase [Candidatus Udaeobacter sp.]
MKIYFVEPEPSDIEFFEQALPEHDLLFAEYDSDVESDCEILSVYIHSNIDIEFLDRHQHLKFVTTRSAGYDHIDVSECARRGIPVSNAAGADANTTAEHTFALMLALARRLYEVREANKQPVFRYEELRAVDLKDKTIGVIGTGRVGMHVVHIALAFGMKVVAYDPYRPSLMAEIFGVRYVDLDELLRESHVISLHAPLAEETFHMLDRAAFAKCQQGVIIINTARGQLIDTSALLDALDSGRVAGAGLDVLEEESVLRKEADKIIADQIIDRLKNHPPAGDGTPTDDPDRLRRFEEVMRNQSLLNRPDVVFTPHVAFNSVEAVERINALTISNINAFLKGRPTNLVNQPREAATVNYECSR